MEPKYINATILSLGASDRTVKLEISGCHTIRSLVEKNFQALTGKILNTTENPWFDIHLPQSKEICHWKMNYCDSWLGPADLIPQHLDKEIFLSDIKGVRSDDSIEFHLHELEKIKKTKSVIDLLYQHETQLLLWSKIVRDWRWEAAPLMRLIFPHDILEIIKSTAMNYYNKFLYQFLSAIYSLPRYKEISLTEGTIKESARHWITDFNYQIQIQILTLLVIPEVFLRQFYSKNAYGVSLQKLGFNSPWGEKDREGENFISGKSLSESFIAIMEELKIESYDDFIVACQQNDESSKNALSKIINLFRIYLNKTKHSSGVEIIRSNLAKEQREWRLQGLNRRIERLEKYQKSSEDLQNLKLKKEFEEKFSYAYEDFSFSDPDFFLKNGILVTLDESRDKSFKITFSDLEFALKILAGVMTALTRALESRGKI